MSMPSFKPTKWKLEYCTDCKKLLGRYNYKCRQAIYIHALKLKQPLRKMIFTGIEHKYNRGNIKASYFVQYYITENENNDSN